MSNAFLIKVTGRAEVLDYERLAHVLSNFNRLGLNMTYMQAVSTGEFVAYTAEVKQKFLELHNKYELCEDGDEKQALAAELAKFPNLDDNQELLLAFACSKGLQWDQQYIEGVQSFIDLFQSGIYEINITPTETSKRFMFRGILDRQWLRIRSAYLRSLYSNSMSSNVVMVAQLTATLNSKVDMPQLQELIDSPFDFNNTPFMRDAFGGVFKKVNSMDKMFLYSGEAIDFIMRPLAIYQETIILAATTNHR